MVLTPAYGRDYTSQTAVLKHFYEGKDFIVNDITNRWNGKPINKDAFKPGQEVRVRYAKLHKVMVFDYDPDDAS